MIPIALLFSLAGAPHIAVMPIEGTDSLDGSFVFSDALDAAVAKAGYGDVMKKDAVADALNEARGNAIVCGPEEAACWVNLAETAKLDQVIVPTSQKTDDGTVLTLRLIDVRGEAEVKRLDHPLTEPQDKAIDEAVARLLFPERFLAAIAVVDAPAGAAIEIDGVPKGNAPLESPVAGLAPGDHEVTIAVAGKDPLHLEVTLAEGQLAKVIGHRPGDDANASSKSSTLPSLPPMALAGGGAAVVGGIAAGVCGFVASGTYNGVYENRTDTNITHAQKESARTTTIALLGCAAATGVAAIAGAGVAVVGLLP